MTLKFNSLPTRAAIVGSGFMGRTHSRAIRASGGQVVAAVGSAPHNAERARMSTGAAEAITSLEELFVRDDIDVVHICTPNATHEGIALAAISAGFNIVCEKPLATSAAAARRIVDAAERANRAGTVPFVYRFHPMVREMRARIARGELGRASVIHGGYLQEWLASPTENNWRVDAASGGESRAFADIGSHWFDLLEFVSSDVVTRVSAQLSTVWPERGGREVLTEDAVTVQFRMASGTTGTCVISQVAAGRKNRLHLEVSGTETSIAFDQESPEQLWLGRGEGSVDLRRDTARLTSDAARLSFLPTGHPQGYQDAFNAFVTDSYSLMAQHAECEEPVISGIPTLAAGLRAAVLCDAVLESGRGDGVWVDTTPGSPEVHDALTTNPPIGRR